MGFGRRGIGKVNWLVQVCTSKAVCMQDVAGEESSSSGYSLGYASPVSIGKCLKREEAGRRSEVTVGK